MLIVVEFCVMISNNGARFRKASSSAVNLFWRIRMDEKRLQGHDWRSTIRDATQAAEQNIRQGVAVDGRHIVWEMLREAANVSRIA